MRTGRILTTIAAAVFATVGVLAPSTSASAAEADCPSGHFCIWENDNFSGAMKSWEGDDSNWHDNGWGDRADSMKNNGVAHQWEDVAVYMHTNFGDEDECLDRGESADFWMDDDDYSSHKWQPWYFCILG